MFFFFLFHTSLQLDEFIFLPLWQYSWPERNHRIYGFFLRVFQAPSIDQSHDREVYASITPLARIFEKIPEGRIESKLQVSLRRIKASVSRDDIGFFDKLQGTSGLTGG